MTEREPFTDNLDDVDAEIEANEKRHVDKSEPFIEQTLDDVIRPFTNALNADQLTPEEREASLRENDRAQRPD